LNKYLTIAGVLIELVNAEQQGSLESFYQAYAVNDDLSASYNDSSTNKLIGTRLTIDAQTDKQNGLSLTWHRDGCDGQNAKEPLSYYLDFVKTVSQQRSFPAAKQGAFNQALGKKTKTVVDATGGWGGDALLMCMQGYQVTVIERQPVMALLLTDAFSRLAECDWAIDNNIYIPRVICGNAADVFKQQSIQADCVYFDPMFPPKRKKSAAVNKQMQLLHQLVGEDTDAEEVLSAALNNGFERVAVKRPHHANPLLCSPSTQFSSKLVHYDVYLK